MGPSGEKTVAFEQYFTSPRVDVLRENILGPSDILAEIVIPEARSNTQMSAASLPRSRTLTATRMPSGDRLTSP